MERSRSRSLRSVVLLSLVCWVPLDSLVHRSSSSTRPALARRGLHLPPFVLLRVAGASRRCLPVRPPSKPPLASWGPGRPGPTTLISSQAANRFRIQSSHNTRSRTDVFARRLVESVWLYRRVLFPGKKCRRVFSPEVAPVSNYPGPSERASSMPGCLPFSADGGIPWVSNKLCTTLDWKVVVVYNDDVF
jgi:hypothetical protein